MPAQRKPIDWEAIEREYRAGQLSVREIASQFGCSHTAIQKAAKKGKWARDLSKAVAKAVARKTVAKVANLHADATDKEIIEAVAERGAEVNDIHRKDIRQSQTIVKMLHGQLVEAINSRSEIEETIIEETAKDEEGGKTDFKRRSLMLKAVSIPTHIGCIKDLSIAQRNLITLERQAFNLDNSGDDPGDDFVPVNGDRRKLLKEVAREFVKKLKE